MYNCRYEKQNEGGRERPGVIPKELREPTGIKEGTEVTVGLKDGAVTITREPPHRELHRILHKHLLEEASPRVNIKRLLEEERAERHKRAS